MSKNLLRKLFRLANNPHDVGFLHNQKVLSINFHLSAAPFAEQDTVALFDIERGIFTVITADAWSNCDNFAFGGFFSRCIRDNDPASGFGVFFDACNNNAVMEGTKFCLLYTSPSPRDQRGSRMPSSA